MFLAFLNKNIRFACFDTVDFIGYNGKQHSENVKRSHLMLEKIKYFLSEISHSTKVRIKGIALMCAVTVAASALLGFSVNTVKIFDGEKTYTVRSIGGNLASVLSTLDLKSKRYQIVKTSVDDRCTTVEIAYTFPVFVTMGEITKEIEFAGGTVKEALKLAGYDFNEFDFVEPAADTVITDTAYIDYTDIEYVTGSYTEKIPHTTETVYSADKEKGSTSVTEGSDGVKQVNYTEKFVNGVSAERKITGETVLTAAVSSTKTVGTKSKGVTTSASTKAISTLAPAAPIELDANGVPVKYKSKMISRATAYTYTGNNCSTGVAPQPGYIAVNPKVIPYGTKMYIKSSDGKYIYGYAVAADTGGFIKKHPTGVDLFMETRSECINFGVRNVEIYILE